MRPLKYLAHRVQENVIKSIKKKKQEMRIVLFQLTTASFFDVFKSMIKPVNKFFNLSLSGIGKTFISTGFYKSTMLKNLL